MSFHRTLTLAALLIPGPWFLAPALAQSPGNFSTLSTAGTATMNGDVLMCSGRPWIDVKCPNMAGGAVGDGSHDDTAAIQAAIDSAVTNNWPVHIPAGTYKVTSLVTIDYAGQASSGFRLVSEGAAIDGRTIATGPVLQVECSGGTTGSPTGCFYYKQEGALSVLANTPAYAVVIGKSDFSDAHNSLKLDRLVVNNASTAAASGGLQLNYVLDSDIFAIADSAGGAAGLALEQTQFSRISGAGSAAATGGSSLLLEQGYNYANTIFAFDMEVSPTCLRITANHDGMNSFVSPYFACTTAVSATASTHNVLINPTYAGNVVNRGPQSTGIEVIGGGNWSRWQFPSVSSYTAAPIDDKTVLSSFNTPGSALAVTLPAPSAVAAGWAIGFATDNAKGLTVTASAGAILAGGKTATSMSLGPGNYEYLQLESDGTNFRVTTATRGTLAVNGMVSRDWPGNWLYPSSGGYAAGLGDNGNVVSSFNTPSGLSVTLPSVTGLPSGWSMGFATDNAKGVTIQVNGTSGGLILYPLASAAGQTSLSLAGTNFEFLTLQYDGGGNFRVEQVTPATAQQLGLAGTGGLSRWRFPSVSAYSAGLADNGSAISASNSPLSFLTVTLPPVTAINPGWTLAIANDNSKLAAVQVNPTDGGKLLYPGSGAAVTSLQLDAGDYETAILQFDGTNFRVVQLTPASAASIGLTGGTCSAKWKFPSVSTYAAGATDCGTVLSNFNTPISSLTVTLPSTTAIAAGWSMSFASDNNKSLVVQVNGTSGGLILLPGTRGGQSALTLYGGNYELVSYRTATLTAAHRYDLTYLRRGIYGTPIGAHGAGSSFARFGPNDPSLFRYRYPASFVGTTVQVKLPGFNIFGQALQDLAGLTPTGYTLTGDGAVSGPAYVSGSWSGSPPASQIVERYIFATPVTFPSGLGGSYGSAGSAATASASFAIEKNGSAVGAMSFAAGASAANFTMASATLFAGGDVLTIVAPAAPDASLANLAWTLSGVL